MVSMIHDATNANKGRKDSKTNMEIKKPYAVGQYNKLIKGVDRTDQYQLLLGSEENYKMVKKGSTTRVLQKVSALLYFCGKR